MTDLRSPTTGRGLPQAAAVGAVSILLVRLNVYGFAAANRLSHREGF